MSSATSTVSAGSGHAQGSRWKLMLGTLGVVYGDIGTSPLYAMKECFSPESPHHVDPSRANVLGILSLIFWSLTLVVSFKYLTFIMRADNEGKGGILALLALLPQKGLGVAQGALVLLVLFGASLLSGEGVITPAISVLSAVEGLEVATSTLKPIVLPLTCGILIGLFAIQKRGTGGLGVLFGPLTLLWFLTIAALGIGQIVRHPGVLAAVDPRYAVGFFVENGAHGFLMLGGVVLAITGVEALYADMGHFGLPPIRTSWLAVVMPALLLNYFGQGALLLADPGAGRSPFYGLVPSWGLYPVVIIATAATVVASQALISGVFSLTQQAVQLGFCPRVTIVHTSKHAEGQIYIPEVNWGLLVACTVLVLSFRSSTALAAAYGIAVTGTMSITSIVYYAVVTRAWKWPASKALPLVLLFLVVDLSFFAANAAKFFDGGWFPIAMGLGLFAVMTTWKRGRQELARAFQSAILPFDVFREDVERTNPPRVNGTAVFMASSPTGTPTVLLHHFKHNQVLHKQVVLLSVLSEQVPEIPPERRVQVEPLGLGFYRITVRYGFMEQPDVPRVLEGCSGDGLSIELRSTSYYLGRETLLPTGKSGMSRWRKALFAFISRNARPATAYFGLPANRVVELGMQIDL
ncbi:MAG: potassium transporter Kup [Polyangiaceae bacterium]|nr:potassium transporter Kup [Polyangiaceae bacterium]